MAVFLLLLGATVAGVLTASWLSNTPADGPQSAEMSEVRQPIEAPPKRGSSQPQELDSDTEHSSAPDVAEDSEPSPEVDDVRRVRIECRDLSGEPVPGVELHVRIQAPTSTYRTPEWHSENFRKRTPIDGGFEVASKPSHELRVWLADKEATKWFTPIVDTTFDQVEIVRMILRPVATLRLRIQYDDGLPYTGLAMIHTLPEEGEQFQLTIKGAEDGTVTIPGAPTDRTLRTRNFERRPGYVGKRDHWTYIEPHQWTSGQEVLVVIPKPGDPLGALEVRFPDAGPTAFGDRRRTRYILESTVGGPHTGDVATGSASWSRASLPPEGKYRVTFLGPVSWQSEWVELEPGKLTVVHAELKASASVRVRLLDGLSVPLLSGSVKMSDGAYVAYSGSKSPRSRGAHPADLPDENGVVTLRGLPAGSQKIEIEAFGKETLKLEVELQPGEARDLGDVVLPDAIGRVTVHVSGRQEGINYSVVVFQPNQGSSLYPYVPVSDDVAEVPGLPLRPYRVGVIRSDNGRITGTRVDLTAENPHATIHLDVSGTPD